ncbi:MAG: hypothetical protein ACJ8DI_28630 [Ktedonobacteraceae bacterium]
MWAWLLKEPDDREDLATARTWRPHDPGDRKDLATARTWRPRGSPLHITCTT